MSASVLTANGSTPWISTNGRDINPTCSGTFSGGTMALEKRVNGVVSAVYDGTTPITATASEDMIVSLGAGTQVRWTLSGATSPSINWSLYSMS